MDVPEHIKFLIIKWRQRCLSKADLEELDNWYNTPLPETIYMEGQDGEHIKAKLFKRIEREMGDEQKNVVRLLPVWAKVAAAIFLILGVTFLFTLYRDQSAVPGQSYTVQSQDTIKRIILPDSSIVWLKKNSHFSYPRSFGKDAREVELHGEAFFEIAHNKRWPFKIKSGNYVTTVLGTSFNLKTGDKDEEYAISVLTGKVEVVKKMAYKGNKVYLISASQSFHAESGKVEKLLPAHKDEQVQALIQGTQYDMAFVKMPFEMIMKRFEEKFDVHFEGYTGEYNSCVVTADLTNISLEKSLQILCSSINATYKIDHNKIKLTGGGCF